MSDPRIPYFSIPELVLLPRESLGTFPSVDLSVKPFGALVAVGVYVGVHLATKHARRLGLNDAAMASFIVWAVGGGFIGGHVFDILFYFPERILEDPWSLLRVWEGLSSLGGILGALIGVASWSYRHRARVLPYADVVCASLATGFAFGRLGCAIVHDHPGIRSDAWYAVAYPGGGRVDLGLFEFLVLAALAFVLWLLQKRPRPWGFFSATLCLCYAPARFALDFLRMGDAPGADKRYGVLTPAQWACVGAVLGGWFLLLRMDWSATAPPEPPEAFRLGPTTS